MANRGHSEDREHSRHASMATISPDQSGLVISPSSEHQINGRVHELDHNQTRVLPSFASIVDPDEGTTLEFIPVSEFNGTKCAKLA